MTNERVSLYDDGLRCHSMMVMSSGDRSETRTHLVPPSLYLISEILVRKPISKKNEIILDKVRFL